MLNRKDYWGYISQFLQNTVALIFLPIVLPELDANQIFLWYLLMNMIAFSNLLDFGITNAFSRNITYSLNGAKEIHSFGFASTDSHNKSPNYELSHKIVSASKYFFVFTSFIFFVVLAAPTYFYGQYFNDYGSSSDFFLAWALFSISIIINNSFRFYNAIIQGRDRYDNYFKSQVSLNFTFLFLSILLFYFEQNLMIFGTSYLVAVMFSRFLARYFAYNNEFGLKLSNTKKISFSESFLIFKTLWSMSWRFGVSALGAFLIIRGSFFVIGIFLGPETASSYFLSLQIFTVIQSFSLIYTSARLPLFASLNLDFSNNLLRIQKIIRSSYFISIFTYLTLSLLAIMLLPILLDRFQSNINLIDQYLLIFLMFILLLETVHANAAAIITTLNQVPFYKASIISGILIVCTSYFYLNEYESGLVSVMTIHFLVQLSYNNWKWPFLLKKYFY